MNQDPQFHVVLDIDGTTPPIKVVSGSEDPYYDAIKNRCKKTADFRRDYKRPDKPSPSVGEAFKDEVVSRCSCDKEKQKKFWHKRFPVCRILQKYKLKDDLPNDTISGLTVGIMQLPQGRNALIVILVCTGIFSYTVTSVLSGHSKTTTKIGFQTDYRLMQVKSIAVFCNTFDYH